MHSTASAQRPHPTHTAIDRTHRGLVGGGSAVLEICFCPSCLAVGIAAGSGKLSRVCRRQPGESCGVPPTAWRVVRCAADSLASRAVCRRQPGESCGVPPTGTRREAGRRRRRTLAAIAHATTKFEEGRRRKLITDRGNGDTRRVGHGSSCHL